MAGSSSALVAQYVLPGLLGHPCTGAGAPDAEARLAVTAPFLHWPPPPHWHIKQPPGEGPPGLQPAPFPARHGLGLPYTRRPALSYPLPALPLQLFLCRSPVLVTLCSSHRPGTRAEAPSTSVLTSDAPFAPSLHDVSARGLALPCPLPPDRN